MKATAAIALSLWVVSCGTPDAPPPPKPEPVKPAAPAAPPPPFTGTLTPSMIMAAKGLVHPVDAWDTAYAQLQAKLGAPTLTGSADDRRTYTWAALDGDTCAYIEVSERDGAEFHRSGMIVGSTQNPMQIAKDGSPGNRADCLRAAGKGPVDDPNAPGPKGARASVGEVLANAPHARSKWSGMQLAVSGIVKSTGSQTDDSGTVQRFELADAADPTGPSLTVWMAPGVEDKAAKATKPATFTCTIKLVDGFTMAGEPTLDVQLAACTDTPDTDKLLDLLTGPPSQGEKELASWKKDHAHRDAALRLGCERCGN